MSQLVSGVEEHLEFTKRSAPLSLAGLTENQSAELGRGVQRLKEFGDLGQSLGLRLLVDAEYTYMNPGISVMALAMMRVYNVGREAVVANTYQCYLKVIFVELYLYFNGPIDNIYTNVTVKNEHEPIIIL